MSVHTRTAAALAAAVIMTALGTLPAQAAGSAATSVAKARQGDPALWRQKKDPVKRRHCLLRSSKTYRLKLLGDSYR